MVFAHATPLFTVNKRSEPQDVGKPGILGMMREEGEGNIMVPVQLTVIPGI